jgi:L-arabinose isomerase
MEKLKIGLLPLYIKLYDDHWPEIRERADAFHHTIASELQRKGMDVVSVRLCRIKTEFEEAIQIFEEEGVDAVVTLHLAYSPSLESASLLAATELPIVILDTTPTYDLSPLQLPDEIMYNHGIHGVQDLCNLLLRSGKEFQIEAGHWSQSNVLDRVMDGVKAAKMTKRMKTAKVGRLGRQFDGMGDFQVPTDILQSTIGMETLEFELTDGKTRFEAVTDVQIEEEMRMDQERFKSTSLDPGIYKQSTEACLMVRSLVEKHQLTAFTINFMEITKQSGLPCMPFMEASKAMEKGVGYAGEGDVLTAALVGALLSVYPDTSFAEMFCPDWQNNRILVSHMGEMNMRIAAEKMTLQEKAFPFTDAGNPVVAYGRFRGGKAVYVSLAPGKDNTYSMILSPVEMLEVLGEDRMPEAIRGWFEPNMPVSDFLASFSKHGGTHHGVIVYGEVGNVLERFGENMGWKVVNIG